MYIRKLSEVLLMAWLRPKLTWVFILGVLGGSWMEFGWFWGVWASFGKFFWVHFDVFWFHFGFRWEFEGGRADVVTRRSGGL